MNVLSLPQTVTLYQPTPAEIDAVLTRAFKAYPAMAACIMRARKLLTNGALTIEPVRWTQSCLPLWQVASQSGKVSHYTITNHKHCSCPNRGQVCGDKSYCKHNIAVAAYLRILRNKINSDIQTFNVELSKLPNGNCHAYAKGLGYVEVCAGADGLYDFVGEASPVAYAIWRAKVSLPVAWPTRESVAVA